MSRELPDERARFEAWLERAERENLGPTPNWFYEPRTIAFMAWQEAVRLEREATDELLRDCAAFFASNVKIAPTDANAKAAELWNRLDAAIRARSQEG